jgi:beta-1,4-mannooligosaccharide/beta-1,4-mannosyl-N-acetylglucosamine phosphorylase
MAFPEPIIGQLTSSKVIARSSENPLLSSSDIPYESSLVFNAGVTFFQGQYVMVFRNDVFSEPAGGTIVRIELGLATSDDGINWNVSEKPCFSWEDDEVLRAYDPRLTVIEGRVYMCFALDTRHGLRGGIAVTDDFDKFEVLSLTVPDNRNMVLFPEKINKKYLRLERPFPVYSRGGRDRFDMWMSDSPDLEYWGNSKLLLAVEDVPFANNKIGPAAPPVLTDKGWLTLFHAVDLDPARGKNGWEERWQKRYTCGVMLLDRNDPSRIKGISRQPLLAPEVDYEIAGGCRNNVIFPGGMILEKSGEVKIYYGAADTVECLATADVNDLLDLCL